MCECSDNYSHLEGTNTHIYSLLTDIIKEIFLLHGLTRVISRDFVTRLHSISGTSFGLNSPAVASRNKHREDNVLALLGLACVHLRRLSDPQIVLQCLICVRQHKIWACIKTIMMVSLHKGRLLQPRGNERGSNEGGGKDCERNTHTHFLENMYNTTQPPHRLYPPT